MIRRRQVLGERHATDAGLRRHSPAKLLERGRQPRIALKPTSPAPAVAKLRKQYPNASDDERILRFMFAGSQVDDMIAAGPMRTEYAFEKPLVRLMRELAARRVSRVHISRTAA